MPSQHTCASIAQIACANATHYPCSYHVYVNKVLWQHMYFVLCRLTSIFGSSYKQLLFYHCLCFLESLSNSGSAGFPRLQLHRTHTCTGVHQCIDLTMQCIILLILPFNQGEVQSGYSKCPYSFINERLLAPARRQPIATDVR